MRRFVQKLERGQSMVEYALIAIPLFLLVFGILDVSRAVFYNHLLTNAAREAARYGIAAQRTHQAVCETALRATAWSLPGVQSSFDCSTAASGPVSVPGFSVTVTRDPVGPGPRYVTVQLSYTFRPITPLISGVIGGAIGGNLVLGAGSSMAIEPE